MASSIPPSALPPAEVDISTSLLRSVSPTASQTSVFQSLATQLELYMKSTGSALFNSQTALEQSHITLQLSKVALQQIATSIAALEEKVDGFLTTTTAYRADINSKWENLTDQLALQATQQLAIQDAVERVSVGSSHAIAKMLRDIKMELANKNDDTIARNNDVFGSHLSTKGGQSGNNTTAGWDEFGRRPILPFFRVWWWFKSDLFGRQEPRSKIARFATSSRTSGTSSSHFPDSLLSTSINTINLLEDDEHIQRNQTAIAALQNEEFYRATGTGAVTDKGQEEDDDIEKNAGNNVIN
ncbi:hypothetical protein BGZ95_005284 [Linnemannia exigua]|uniref:Uncharacterized protein n=1 Tax=Linnemannia exigua TaxID=604196 RepID=A0AAD4D2G6_9FUNG|nr:hypothetical protein BGZ95_005284 [Linnemannia exigua]